MMLHRSASSRRRRASRGGASLGTTGAAASSTPGLNQQQASSGGGPRRASLASGEPVPEAVLIAAAAAQAGPLQPPGGGGGGGVDRQRSPRGSCVPNISLEADNVAVGACPRDEIFSRRLLPDPEQLAASRLGLLPDASRSSRASLTADPDYAISMGARSPRGSLIPPESSSSRSPRHSLVPLDISGGYGSQRSPRGSLVPTSASRLSLLPDVAATGGPMNRSPRHSLVPDVSRSPRGSVANIDYDPQQQRSPRGSICPEMMSRSPRGSITPIEIKERSPRGSIVSECINASPRGSIAPDSLINRSPRGSIAPENLINRSPRGSIAPDALVNRSPRGSIAPLQHQQFDGLGPSNRSPRGSIGGSHRGSLGEDELLLRGSSPRGSIGPELERSPRGSLAGLAQDRRSARAALTSASHEPRRSSADQGTSRNRSVSPYRQRGENSGSMRIAGSGVGQANLGYSATANSWIDSRRASSSVSQFSGADESRRLCGGDGGGPGAGGGGGGATVGPSVAEKGAAVPGPTMGVAVYGSLAYQLKDAHLEASGTCDFVLRALRVVGKTSVVTFVLAALSTVPVFMLIVGVQFIRDCPREPNIPLYMVVGGTLGSLRMFWSLYSQIRARRPEVISMPGSSSHISPKKLASILLSCFLVGWFVLGE
ncbi:hypothetical protein QAD02_007021 [Eretmocerus hayati]|uniref:Uncharacterized protein n=1 Tax=Eretmocerus hayati TaxID=131215 RepID=A0ACC2N4W6_9HYME|nr:hypothetical protein QAD02_007021 [Eretmocerus hayati]